MRKSPYPHIFKTTSWPCIRREFQVIVLNAGAEPFTVERGMRIAQAVLAPVTRAAWREVDTLPDSARGAGGFGSTGTAPVGRGGS